MYQLGQATVTKRVESWRLTVPLHDNNGVNFDPNLIESITQGIVSHFPGLTAINCVGHWRDGAQTYKDRNLEFVIDVGSADAKETEQFFAKYKSDLALHLHQSKIYLTKEDSKTEVLTYDEFFREMGLEVAARLCDAEKRDIARGVVGKVEFLVARMSYETTLLRRDREARSIVWERRVCGLPLRSVIPDHGHPADARLIAADRIDHFAEWCKDPSDVVIVGDWEFQKFVLSGRPFTPLVKSDLPKHHDWQVRQYLSPDGSLISHDRFVEEFTMSILCGIMALRDEGFTASEISINVGADGSLQWTKDPGRTILFYCPAKIPDKEIQQEVLRCVRVAIALLEAGSLPPLGVQQAKAMHRYIFKRGAIRHVLLENPRT